MDDEERQALQDQLVIAAQLAMDYASTARWANAMLDDKKPIRQHILNFEIAARTILRKALDFGAPK